MNDYKEITSETDTIGGLLGTWWRKPPYVLRRGSYLRHRGQGARPAKIVADILSPKREPTEWERFYLEGLEPPLDVVPTGDEGEWYAPVEQPGLLGALLDVGQGHLKPTQFADRFGLLGYDQLVPSQNRCAGDPLDWFMAHTRTVHVIAQLILLLKKLRDKSPGARAALSKYEAKIPDGPYAMGSRVSTIPLRRMSFSGSPVKAAIGIVQYLLNENLGPTARRLRSIETGGLRSVFTFRALIDVIYWQLADQLGRGSIHRCKECGRIFTNPNTKADYCPPTRGKKISRCKSRWNVREFRKRQHRKEKQPRRKQ